MPFPPRDVVAPFGIYMHFQSLGQLLAERHPELAHRIEVPETGPSHLKVRLSETTGVVLAHVRFRSTITWVLTGPTLAYEPTVLPLNTTDEKLVDAVHAHASACLQGAPVPSPWRWHETEASDLTELADRLADTGVHVGRVVVDNYCRVSGPLHDGRLTIDRSDPHLDASVKGEVVRISLKPRLGWMVDLWCPEVDVWTRIDLISSLGRPLSPTPGVPRSALPMEALVDLIAAGRDAWAIEDVAVFTDDVSANTAQRELGHHDLVLTVLSQLSTLGFTDVFEGDAESPLRSSQFHIAWHSQAKELSAPALKTLNGEAAAAGDDVPKRLIVLTRTGLTKPAAAFADQAKAFAFHVDERTGRLYGLHPRASEVLLPRGEPDYQ
ncbi:hypothetical protein [Streptomyces sp. MBT27]|uniref:hypothetical protein n=1 Tax=Streptomyces sp. MBT27 TaxID=1488356 RepID=UPI001F085EA1|nr:hypothetical protein [Streptomyces sp. MBT27]